MNYRHAFHAGNFADLVKHAALLQLLGRLTASGPPLTVIDTHAGRGLYDLAGPEARKSGEAEAGVLRLLREGPPPVFAPLMEAVQALNEGGEVRRYPGSPWLIARALRAVDTYVGFELRPDEHQALASALAGRRNVRTAAADGYAGALRAAGQGRVLLLIDPPFERADDYQRTVSTVADVRASRPGAQALIWVPIKDLETFDGFLRDLEDAVSGPILVGEARMRPLADPMKMNGCAVVLAGDVDLQPAFAEICGWVAERLGEQGRGRAYVLAEGA